MNVMIAKLSYTRVGDSVDILYILGDFDVVYVDNARAQSFHGPDHLFGLVGDVSQVLTQDQCLERQPWR